MATIGENIKYYRERANMPPEELAIRVGIGTSRLYAYESGESKPNNETLFKISTVLDVSISQLTDTRVYFMEF